jgi:dihydropteroate synthase
VPSERFTPHEGGTRTTGEGKRGAPDGGMPCWRLSGADVALSRPVVVGILNVTPDSFSDGGRYPTVHAAVAAAEEMARDGADVLDIGGESTRPGSQRVSEEEELRRVMPVLRAVRRRLPELPISLDTTRSSVAGAGLGEGANAINDVSGLRFDPALANVVAGIGAGLVLMHSRGGADQMASYDLAEYGGDVTAAVVAELQVALSRAREAGVRDQSIVLDPGIGFAKRGAQSLTVLRELDRLAVLGLPIMVGASRKRVVADITGEIVPTHRVYGSVGLHIAALLRGARLFRVHDVRAHRQALDAAWRVLGPSDRFRA